MPKRSKQMTWRALQLPQDCSTDAALQTVQIRKRPAIIESVPSEHLLTWVTVARGHPAAMEKIAEALNRARFELFDISPELNTRRRK